MTSAACVMTTEISSESASFFLFFLDQDRLGNGGCGDRKMVWAAADPDRTRIYADVIPDKQRPMPDVNFGRSLLYVLLNSLSLASFFLAVTSYSFPCNSALRYI